MERWLVSLENQEVPIHALGRSFSFQAWEGIHVECSHKYDLMENGASTNNLPLKSPDIEFLSRPGGAAVCRLIDILETGACKARCHLN